MWTALALVSVLGTAVPLYLLQEGLTRTSTVNVSLLVATIPAVTVMLQLLDMDDLEAIRLIGRELT